jgi:hypothetical protein
MKLVRTLITGTLIAFAVAGLASIGRWIYVHRELATKLVASQPEPAPVA